MQTKFYSYEDSRKYSLQARLKRLETLARWLDARWKLPGTDFKVGLDGVIGLLPGIGDAFTAMLALYTLHEAHHMGAPLWLKLRLLWNILYDMLLGVVPIVGDYLDFRNKAHLKNVVLLRRHFLL